MRFFILWCIGFISFNVMADASLPTGCRAIKVQGNTVTLTAKKSKLVLIHNLAKTDLWLTHPVQEPSASAGWTSRIQSDHWSALAVDQPSFVVSCVESRPGHEQEIPCEGAIAVCQWKGAKMPAGQTGTFWASEDLSLAELTAALGGRGFVLPSK